MGKILTVSQMTKVCHYLMCRNHKFTAMCNLIQMFRVTRAQEDLLKKCNTTSGNLIKP